MPEIYGDRRPGTSGACRDGSIVDVGLHGLATVVRRAYRPYSLFPLQTIESPPTYTRDHSLTERLVTNGTFEADEVPETWQNLLLNSIGGDEDSVLNPDICKMQIQMGDALLLWTDGLTKHVPDSVISEISGQDTMTDDTCVRLLSEVKDREGTDNATVVAARFLDIGEQDVAMIDSLDVETGNTQPPPKANKMKTQPKPIAGKHNG